VSLWFARLDCRAIGKSTTQLKSCRAPFLDFEGRLLDSYPRSLKFACARQMKLPCITAFYFWKLFWKSALKILFADLFAH